MSRALGAGCVSSSRLLARAFATVAAAALVLPGAPARGAPARALAAVRPTTSTDRGAPRAPGGPVLGSGSPHGAEASASAPASGGDPLAGNGLDSPLCREPSGLSAAQRRSCETDSFVAAPDPTNDYAFDVNIDTGVGKWGNDMSATIDDFAQYGWLALVAATHGLVVMFEWCYSLDLLSGALLSQVTGALRNARMSFTEPWLAIVLAIASVLVVYHGLVRRQVAETLGQALAMFAMMAGGLWVMAEPAGTVGAVEQWTNQAGLGTMAAVASGSPEHADRTLADSMQVVFGSVVATPWCYLEFGDVGWCEDTGQLDGALRTAGLRIAKSEEAKSGCRDGCPAGAGQGSRTLFASAALLREAQTNGELFLALPANEAARNSSTKAGTLLNLLCGGGDSADACRGPTSAQAEFRSQKGTGSRVIGLFAIWLGALGMLLLLGFLALRLLGAAVVGLFFLLLAPAAVLAPALGDGGRSAFRGWALKLLEALIAKLTYSFLLGVVLMMMKLLLSLTILGWWVQWLLISAFWWGIFLKRHQTLGWAAEASRRHPQPPHRSMARRMGEALETRNRLTKPIAEHRKRRQPPPEVEPLVGSPTKPPATVQGNTGGGSSPGSGSRSRGRDEGFGADKRRGADEAGEREAGADGISGERKRHRKSRRPAGASLPGRRRSSGPQAGVEAAPAKAGSSGGVESMAHGHRMERLRRERQKALANGDTRRAAKLGVREQRVDREHARHRLLALGMVDPEVDAVEIASAASLAKHAGRSTPPSGIPVQTAQGGQAARTGQAGRAAQTGHARRSGREAPAGRPPSSFPVSAAQIDRVPVGVRPESQRSSVMDDAREVAARRKRQLGWETHSRGPGKPREPGASE